jgi:hypothetical protein
VVDCPRSRCVPRQLRVCPGHAPRRESSGSPEAPPWRDDC